LPRLAKRHNDRATRLFLWDASGASANSAFLCTVVLVNPRLSLRPMKAFFRINMHATRLFLWPTIVCLVLLNGCHQNPQESAEKHYSKAQVYLQQKQVQAAFIELGRAAQLSPEMAKAHHELANLYLQRNEASNAVNELLLTIRYDPEDHEAYTMLSRLLLRTRDLKRAKQIAGEMIKKWPDDRAAKLVMAEEMMASGDPINAREYGRPGCKGRSKE